MEAAVGAVNAAVFSAFMNQAQICMSTERIIVDERIADAFVTKLAARAASLPAGDPRGHVVLGSLVSKQSAEKMDELIADATKKGAKVVAGGKRSGTVVEATVIDRLKPGMRIYEEESFGPVKPVIRVSGEDEAVRIANDIEYGLSAAVFSRDVKRALAIAARIECGICHINGPTVADEAQMPFGGVKGSGYGASAARRRSPSSPTCAGSRSRIPAGTIHSEKLPRRVGRRPGGSDRRSSAARHWVSIRSRGEIPG
jgi:acyl-CoA reductase-like NAD-dependent aldehyde dehydrogenase